jgi:hypothetical protein
MKPLFSGFGVLRGLVFKGMDGPRLIGIEALNP